MKSLFYFADGFGTFPAQKPEYYTAFVLVEDELQNRANKYNRAIDRRREKEQT